MHRSEKRRVEKKISSNQSNHYSSITTVTENSWGDKNRNRKNKSISSMDPMHSVNYADEGMTHTRPLIPDVPYHPSPNYGSPPKPIRSNISRSQESSESTNSSQNRDINTDINLDFEENSPFPECVISEAYHRLDNSLFKEP